MGLIYTIQRDNKEVSELIKYLEDNKSEIKDIILGVRYCNGNLSLNCDTAPLEMLCTLSKMIDLRIDELIQGPDEDDLDDLEDVEEDE